MYYTYYTVCKYINVYVSRTSSRAVCAYPSSTFEAPACFRFHCDGYTHTHIIYYTYYILFTYTHMYVSRAHRAALYAWLTPRHLGGPMYIYIFHTHIYNVIYILYIYVAHIEPRRVRTFQRNRGSARLPPFPL